MSLTEAQTRKQLIDKQLNRAKWLKKYTKEEVNSVKSNFKSKDLVFHSKNIEKGVDKFIDYLYDTNLR